MTKPLKHSDMNRPWAQKCRKPGNRALGTRVPIQHFLVLCEGVETERNYFESMKATLKRGVVDVKISGQGTNTLGLVEAAVGEKRRKGITGQPAYDQIWVVFDRDSFPASDFDNAILKGAAHGVLCAWSNEAFELWYILHFEDRHAGMPREDYKGKLTGYFGATYLKNDARTFEQLMNLGDRAQAILRAEKLELARQKASIPPSRANPCTCVYQLVRELLTFEAYTADHHFRPCPPSSSPRS